jgi:hypothetical protein
MKFKVAMSRRTGLAFAGMLVLVAGAALTDPALALSFGPALLLLALFTCGVRPGEALIERLTARFAEPRNRRAVSARRPRLTLVVRPTGRLLASALAMRPPPAATPLTS